MLKKFAKIVGIVFIVVGILGFIPGITYRQNLLGIFHVNTLHNLVHLATGLIAYLVSRSSMRAAQLYFQIFGIIYAIIGFMGFGYGNRDIMGILANNMADTWLHLIIGVVFIYCGFLYKSK